MGNRHRAREYSLQILFQFDFNDSDRGELHMAFWKGVSASQDVKDFSRLLVEGVLEHGAKIDEVIRRYSENWRLDRMTGVDRNILRMAIFELIYCDEIPKNVTINEAVEIGKKFGSEDSGAFINGILDRVAHEFEIDQPD